MSQTAFVKDIVNEITIWTNVYSVIYNNPWLTQQKEQLKNVYNKMFYVAIDV